MIIAPSILAADFSNLNKSLAPLEKFKNLWMHLDIMDGHFVKNLTFGAPIISSIRSKHLLDAHLMVSNPYFYLDYLKKSNIHNITFHLEADQHILKVLKEAKKYYPSVGISIKPKTKVTDIPLAILKIVDLILIMSVEPGFSGQKFMNSAIHKVKYLNQIKDTHSFKIEVDGGINNYNASILKNAGADILVVASYIFQKDLIRRLKGLQNL